MASNPMGFCELYREFLVDARLTLTALARARALQQSDEFRNKAHYLKSSSSVLGARRLAEICAELEELGRSSNLNGADQKLAQAAEMLAQTQGELVQRLGTSVVPAVTPAA